jgi:hypothetical protein
VPFRARSRRVRKDLALSPRVNEHESTDEAANRKRCNQDRPHYLAASALMLSCLLDQVGTHDQ